MTLASQDPAESQTSVCGRSINGGTLCLPDPDTTTAHSLQLDASQADWDIKFYDFVPLDCGFIDLMTSPSHALSQ